MTEKAEDDPCLTQPQIARITGLKQPKRQVTRLREMGYPAFLRPDNTVSLGREQYARGPQREQSKLDDSPRLRDTRRHGKAKKNPRPAGERPGA